VQVVRVLNSVTWQPLLECHHGSPVEEPAEVAVYQEVEEPRGVLAPMQVCCVVIVLSVTSFLTVICQCKYQCTRRWRSHGAN
jgi:hypothetical protein